MVHHVADPASIRYWRRFFVVLFGGLMVLTGLAMALALPGQMASLWWVMALVFVVGEAALWLFLGTEVARSWRYEAVVTATRVLWAAGWELRLAPGQVARASGNAVRIYAGFLKYRLVYPADGAALARRVNEIIAATGGAKA